MACIVTAQFESKSGGWYTYREDNQKRPIYLVHDQAANNY